MTNAIDVTSPDSSMATERNIQRAYDSIQGELADEGRSQGLTGDALDMFAHYTAISNLTNVYSDAEIEEAFPEALSRAVRYFANH